MAKYDFDLSEPKGDWTKDEIAFYQAIHNVKLMANYINKDSKLKRKWFATYNIGQDNANLVVESNDVGIRLFFEFTNTGYVYVSSRDTSGATYNDRNIGGWNYSKTNDWISYFDMIIDVLENYWNKLFESKEENKNMKKSIRERFNAPKDWDFEEMISDYGREYLGEHNPDEEPFEMEMINDFYSGQEPLEILQRAFFGERYGFKNDSFNPNDDFFAFNGYGNLISIVERDLDEYLESRIDEKYFYEWCVDNGYFESEEDE